MSPRIYLAARYSRRYELLEYRNELFARGCEVTSRWLEGDHEIGALGSDQAVDEDRRRFACEDWDDLRSADLVIAFTEEPRSTNGRGGRHVELGAALAWGKPVIVVGPRENVFCHLPGVHVVDTWEAARRLLPSHVADLEALRGTRNGRREALIEALERTLRRARAGEIDGVVMVTTRGRVVAYSSWLNISAGALPAVSISLQGLNANAVNGWWERSTVDNGDPSLRAVGGDEDGPPT